MSEKVSAVRVITSAWVWVVRIGRRKRRTEIKTREAEWVFMAAENISKFSGKIRLTDETLQAIPQLQFRTI